MTECKHLLPPDQCTICLHPIKRKTDLLFSSPPLATTTSRYYNTCPYCDDPINTGDHIGKGHDDDWGHIYHFGSKPAPSSWRSI